jgi:hypothetical protein
MKRFLALMMLLVCGCAFLFPACALEYGNETALVDGLTADRVHLRAAPSTGAASLGLYFSGTEAALLGLDAQWAHIRIGGVEGYMLRRYLRIDADPRTATDRRPRGEVIPAAGASLRYTPDLTQPAAGTAVCGTGLILLGETAGHAYYVQAGEDRFYLPADQVRITGRPAAPDAPAARELRQVLQDELPFVNAADGRSTLLSGYSTGLLDVPCLTGRFALADLDRDGTLEAALEYWVEDEVYGYLLLDAEGSKVYGYECSYRGLTELKQDGSAGWSNGAGNNGFGWRSLWADDLTAAAIARCDDSSGEIVYTVNGREATSEAYIAAIDRQFQKPGAVWYALTEDNLNMLFAK